MTLRVLCYLFCLLAVAAPSAAPARAAASSAIVGRVVDGTNDQRLGNALVTIAGGGLTAPEKIVADSDGQFVLRNLAPGIYSIAVKYGGYLDSAFGVRTAGGPPRVLYLNEDERRDDIVIRMFKAATIVGRVTDTDNHPIVDANVRAYKRMFIGGRPALIPVGDASTNVSGDYAIGKLEPGDYIVSAPMPMSSSVSGPVRDGGAPMSSAAAGSSSLKKYATTYYPFARTASRASAVPLSVGELRQAVDIQVEQQSVVSVSGRVVSRGLMSRVQLDLIAQGEDEVGGNRVLTSTVANENGSFTFSAVPPGEYVLRAFQAATGAEEVQPPEWAEEPVSISDKGVADLTLFLRRGSTVRGRIDLDGSVDDANLWAAGLIVSLDPASVPRYPPPQPRASQVSISGKTFTITDVLPGRYLVRAFGGNRSVKAVMYQGRDVAQSSFVIDKNDLADLTVILTDRPTELTGTVTGTNNLDEARVLIFPQDQRAWLDFGMTPITVRTIDVSYYGAFEIRNMPAGDYLLAAFDESTGIDWQNPAFLQSIAPKATRIRLGAGERQSADLKVLPIR